MEKLFVLASIPVPRDLMLPLPLPEEHLKFLLVLFFLAHILFVNLMVGGSVVTIVFEILGLWKPRYDKLAKKVAETVTVNKSMAVVMGIGPLLCINLLYTVQFYAANVMTGHAWAALIPLVTAAFLLTYAHKYSWYTWTGPRKIPHILLGVSAMLIFLFIPIIFLSNINLMLFPERWSEVKGFLSSLKIGNVMPRYFHFMAACGAVTCLFLAGWFGRRKYPLAEELPGFERASLMKRFYGAVLFITLAQFFFGPLILFTLPMQGLSPGMLAPILSGALLALVLMSLLYLEIVSKPEKTGRLFGWITLVFTVIVSLMGTGRHLYRENSLAGHKQMVFRRTQEFKALEYAAEIRSRAEAINPKKEAVPAGEVDFKQSCAMCHGIDTVIVGPPVTEIASLYAGNVQGIVDWSKAPGKKRPNMIPMPAQSHLSDETLKQIAEYMLQAGASAKS